MRLCLLLGLLLCCSSLLAGLPETPQFRQLTVADGLPSSTLYAVTQDKKGYLWIASKDGLARYDGVGYKIYRYAPGDDNSLPGNVVQALHVDKQDRLWIAVEGQGLSRLNAERTDFTHFRKSTHPEIGSDDIWAMTSTADGNLWFGTYGGGLHRINANGGIKRFMPQNGDNSLPGDTIMSLTVDKQDRLWIGTTKGLCFWDGKKFTSIKIGKLLNTFILQLVTDQDGSIWVGTSRGLIHLSDNGEILNEVLLSGKPITGLWQDRQGAVWFSDGPNVFQWRDQHLLSYTPDSQVPAKIYGVFEDHEGGFWFPTEDRGLLRLPAGWRNFSVFRHQALNRESLSGSMVHATFENDKDHVWSVSQGGGLDRINLANGRIKQVLSKTEKWTTHIWSVLQTRNGVVWLGHDKGILRFDPGVGELENFTARSGEQSTLLGPVRLLTQTNDGLLWSASYGGGIQARNETGRVVHQIVPGDGKGLKSADPDQFASSPEGELWVATAEGLLRWDDDVEKFFVIPGSPKERVDAFCFLATDTVWVHHIGVLEAFHWDGKKLQSLRRVSSDDGLPPVEVGSILPDRNGNLWLTTTRGLLRYNVLTHQFRMFGERDGLPSQEFDMQPALLMSNGLALVGSTKGLVVFDPSKIRNPSVFSPLVLDSISVRRGEDKINFSDVSPIVDLQSGDRDLTVKLRLLSFSDASMHHYRFLLDGYDDDWVEAGSSGERVFSSLPAGNYQLRVKAADAEGRWSEPLKLKFVVQPPWWRTAWANVLWALLFVVGFLALALLYRRRIKLRHDQGLRDQEREIAQQNSAAKSHFLATLGHEIRTPMTGVLGMAELLQAGELNSQQRHRVNAIQGAGRHLLRLVNDVLDLAQIEAGKLRLHDEVFDVKVLIQEVAELLKPLAEIKGLSFDCIMDKSTPDFCRGDAGRVRQILLNLGNNAIKFTEQGQVWIRSAGLIPHGLQLTVSDTGPGMSDEQQTRLFQRFEQAEGNRTNQRYGGSGLGLAICQELAAAMNGHVEIKSSLGQGAVFIVELALPTAEKIIENRIPETTSQKNAVLRILLVEDEPLVAEVLIGLLQAMGHHVSHAHQGLQALSRLAVQKFDLALLDLDLPGIDGFELARLIQTQGYCLPLVAITARADAQVEPAAFAVGMKAFIRKPVNTADLQELLQTLVLTDHSV